MNDLGELDCPGTPSSPGAWDARSGEWLDADGRGVRGEDGGGTASEVSGRTASAAAGGSTAAEADGGVSVSEVAGGVTVSEVARGTTASDAAGGDAPAESAAGHRRPEAAAAVTSAAKSTTDRRPPAPRRGAADPVKALMHRHRELCRRAVDPLEIAAGLEAHGVTDRTAARFRHRDVFSLAEEMYARVPRDGDAPAPATPTAAPRARADWVVLTLLPGALCAATVAALRLTDGRPRLFAAAAGTLTVALALRAALRRGPLSTTGRPRPGTPRSTGPSTGSTTWTCWLIGYALLGDGLLRTALTGGPDGLPTGTADGPWPLTAAPVLALALACAPAAWTAHLFTARARRKLTASRGLADFTASVRPLLLGTFALFLCAPAALLALCSAVLDEPAPYAETLALGALLFLARLLAAHGCTHAPPLVLTATATAQAAALATVFAARLPGCGFLALPVETLVTTWGPTSVPLLTCGAAALTLLIHAFRRLTRASAHAPSERPR